MQTKIIERYFFFGLLLAVLIFTFFIFKPFWVVLVLGASFAIVLYPLYDWLKKRKFPSWLSSLLVVLFFVILICGPLLGIGIIVFNQSQNAYQAITANGNNLTPFIEKINHSVNSIMPSEINFDLKTKISSFISFLSSNAAKIFSVTLSAIFSFLLLILSIFYFLKDGAQWRKSLVKLSPLADTDDEKIIRRFSETVNAVIKGYLTIALLQGIMMGIGLYIFKVPNPALWGVIAGIVSLIPSVGTALVSVPAVIFLYATGHTINAFGMLTWAILMVGMIDNLVSPIIVSKKIKIPSFIIMFSILGGIILLGPIGILVGPLTVSLLYTLISIYRNEFK